MLEPPSPNNSSAGPRRQLAFIPMAFWMLMAGVIYLLLIRTRNPNMRNAYGIAAGILGAAGIVAWLMGRRGSTASLLLVITCALIVAMIVWNVLFHAYVRHSGYAADNFRRAYQTMHAPVYGTTEQPLRAYMIWPILATALAVLVVLGFHRRFLNGDVPVWAFVLLQLTLSLAFALSDGGNWFRLLPVAKEMGLPTTTTTTQQVVHEPHGIREFLRDYVAHMPEGGQHERGTAQGPARSVGRMAHYPPGVMVYRDWVLKSLGLRRVIHFTLLPLVCLTPLPLYGLLRELGLKRSAINFALLLFSTAMGVLVFARADFSALSMLFTSLCFWLLLRGARTGEWWVGIAFGVAYALFMMWVFSATIVGLMMALVVVGGLATGSLRFANVARTVLVGAAVFIVIYGALYAWSGFNIYACFQQGRADERAELGSGFDDARRYLFRSTGHILAFLIATGFAITSFALMALPSLRPRRWENALVGVLAWSVVAGILIAGFSGAFHGETERVWLFFTPLLAAVAGFEWQRRTAHEGRALLGWVIVLILAANCGQELLYRHQARNVRREAPKQRAVQMQNAEEAD